MIQHTASASHIFSEAKANDEPEGEPDMKQERAWTEVTTTEHLQHRKADISRCWAKYCLALLQYSKDNAEEAEQSKWRLCSFDYSSVSLYSPIIGVFICPIGDIFLYECTFTKQSHPK